MELESVRPCLPIKPLSLNYRFAHPDNEGLTDADESFTLTSLGEFQWKTMRDMKVPRTRAAVAICAGEIYVIGGHGDDQCSIESFNTLKNCWYDRSPMNSWRFDVGIAEYNDYIYAVGGFFGSEYVDIVEKYDAHTDAWTTVNIFFSTFCRCSMQHFQLNFIVFADESIFWQILFEIVCVRW